jgi:hypothetical protein
MTFAFFGVLSCSLYSAVDVGQEVAPVAWWPFDSVQNGLVQDNARHTSDPLKGYQALTDGVRGKALRFDGYTTHVVCASPGVPRLGDAFTIQAWVALQALPWNWTAILDQGGNPIPGQEAPPPPAEPGRFYPGLIGALYGEPDLTDPQGKVELASADSDWTGGAKSWSARWRGYVTAPHTGDVTFSAEADDGLRLFIGNTEVISGWAKDGARSGSVAMENGKRYPVLLMYTNNGDPAFLRLSWNWPGQARTLIPIEFLGFSERDRLLAAREIVPAPGPAQEFEQRVFLGIDAHGRVGFKVRVDGRLSECVSNRALPLLRWSLVTATFDEQNGLSIFIDGQPAGSLSARGKITPPNGTDILIGKSRRRSGPDGAERKASADWPSDMVLEGLLDEVKIYSRALTAGQIGDAYKAQRPAVAQPLQWSPLPSGPVRLPRRFDAVYTRLRYTDEWEEPWRVGCDPDILLHFDELPVRFLFWRGTGYGGVWVTENGLWMADQSLERAGPGKSPWGCAEHMSDKQTRYSSVRIIEKSDARIVLQWRYAVADITYTIFGSDAGGRPGEWADEYYFIYPDGVSTRHQNLWTGHLSHEWQETIVLNQPGTRPEDNIELAAMTLANLKGEHETYSWEKGPPAAFSRPENPNIQITNLKSRFRPFIIFEPGPAIRPFRSAIRPEMSHFPWWNHWPVAQLPNDGRRAMGPDRPSHSSLSQSIEESGVIHRAPDGTYSAVTLIGMTDRPIADLVPLARSWNNPPELTVSNPGFVNRGYEKRQRAYLLERNGSAPAAELSFALAADQDSPLVNPAFVVSGWGSAGALLKVNGISVARGKDFRLGHRKSLEGVDLVVWIVMSASKPVNLEIIPIAR